MYICCNFAEKNMLLQMLNYMMQRMLNYMRMQQLMLMLQQLMLVLQQLMLMLQQLMLMLQQLMLHSRGRDLLAVRAAADAACCWNQTNIFLFPLLVLNK